jgi:putative endonuclease
LKAHAGVVAGGAKYTKSHPPLGVECVWSTESKEAALRLEFYFKRLKKADKEKFVSGDYSLEVFFGEKFDISEYRRASEFEGDISEV